MLIQYDSYCTFSFVVTVSRPMARTRQTARKSNRRRTAIPENILHLRNKVIRATHRDETENSLVNNFVVSSGPISFPSFSLSIAPVGDITLPLSPNDAVRLLSLNEESQSGESTTTPTDNSTVSHYYRIDTNRISISQSFTEAVMELAKKMGKDAGVTNPVTAKFCGAFLYPPGGSISTHRKTNSSALMFGSLIVQIPSLFEGGGDLAVQFRNNDKVFDVNMSQDCSTAFHATAFSIYSEYESEPIESGHRLCLMYNLLDCEDVSFSSLLSADSKVVD